VINVKVNFCIKVIPTPRHQHKTTIRCRTSLEGRIETINSNMSYQKSSTSKCGLFEILLFLAAILLGTLCSICSKTMMGLHGVGMNGEVERFEKPIFQTFGMFVGMTFGLVMHSVVLLLKIPFPGYDHANNKVDENNTDSAIQKISECQIISLQCSNMTSSMIEEGVIKESHQLISQNNTSSSNSNDSNFASETSVPLWMYFFLAIPSIFDLTATVLCMLGLRYLDVSVYQLLRGSGIIFVALMKQHVLGDSLYKFQWIGVGWNVISVCLVGLTAMLNTASERNEEIDPKDALFGVLMVLAGAFVQALQFVFEEKVMAMDEASVPPLLLIGMEGLWGTVICLIVAYPIAYFLPGHDHGSFENPYNTFAMIMNSGTIQMAFLIYFFTIFGYNLLAVLVTFTLNSIWHAILDNFRPITVWGTNLIINYAVSDSGNFGEPWTNYSYIQLLGTWVLLYGTAVYNAPNAGSIQLKGEWYSFFLDLSHEYDIIEQASLQTNDTDDWEESRLSEKQRRLSSTNSIHLEPLKYSCSSHKVDDSGAS
jgi:drug/metabolite transporter (DMT)-like permease